MNTVKQRSSGIELFRIITMLVIVAHHYVVNSGLTDILIESAEFSLKNVFYWLFGWGGKTGINCFVLITGYFMCKSKITLEKFLRLLLEVEFYRIIIYLIFCVFGVVSFELKSFVKAVLPVTAVSHGFTAAYLLFYLFIPFLNILVSGIDKRLHLILIGLCLTIYTILPTIGITVVFNYVTWFCIIYLIGSYIRLYPHKLFDSKKNWGVVAVLTLIASWLSVIAGAWILSKYDKNVVYWFVVDSNKLLAVATAISGFMFFKNLDIGYKKWINTIAASAFGVFLIHANSAAMRQWLWVDILDNVGIYNTNIFMLHSVLSVVIIYTVCTILDIIRIKVFERPLFKFLKNAKKII